MVVGEFAGGGDGVVQSYDEYDGDDDDVVGGGQGDVGDVYDPGADDEHDGGGRDAVAECDADHSVGSNDDEWKSAEGSECRADSEFGAGGAAGEPWGSAGAAAGE